MVCLADSLDNFSGGSFSPVKVEQLVTYVLLSDPPAPRRPWLFQFGRLFVKSKSWRCGSCIRSRKFEEIWLGPYADNPNAVNRGMLRRKEQRLSIVLVWKRFYSLIPHILSSHTTIWKSGTWGWNCCMSWTRNLVTYVDCFRMPDVIKLEGPELDLPFIY